MVRIKGFSAIGLFMLLGICATAANGAPVAEAATDKPPMQLSGGASSIDELVKRYVAAFQARDKEGLHALRVTKEEFWNIITPGTVERGKPPRQVTDMVTEYFWKDSNYKSELYADMLIERYAEFDLPPYEIVFTKGAKEYAWYRAWGELRLDYEDDIKTAVPGGWIAEVDGVYKFLGFEWDY